MNLKRPHDPRRKVEHLGVDLHGRNGAGSEHDVAELLKDGLRRNARIKAVELEQRVELQLVLRVRLNDDHEAAVVRRYQSSQVGNQGQSSKLVNVVDLERVEEHQKPMVAKLERPLVNVVLLLQLVD